MPCRQSKIYHKISKTSESQIKMTFALASTWDLWAMAGDTERGWLVPNDLIRTTNCQAWKEPHVSLCSCSLCHRWGNRLKSRDLGSRWGGAVSSRSCSQEIAAWTGDHSALPRLRPSLLSWRQKATRVLTNDTCYTTQVVRLFLFHRWEDWGSRTYQH